MYKGVDRIMGTRDGESPRDYPEGSNYHSRPKGARKSVATRMG